MERTKKEKIALNFFEAERVGFVQMAVPLSAQMPSLRERHNRYYRG